MPEQQGLPTIYPELAKFGRDARAEAQRRGMDITNKGIWDALTFLDTSTNKRTLKAEVAIRGRDPVLVAELREQYTIPNLIKLGDLVAFAETVMMSQDTHTRAKYEEIFQTGLINKFFRQKLRKDYQVESRDMQYIIENQSPDLYRSVVEVTSNAIDFSPPDKPVKVTFGADGYTVEDQGSGMSPATILEKLLIPTISGARDKKESIGKFGVGFMTALNHLQQNGDEVIVESFYEGQGYAIRFVRVEEEILVELKKLKEITSDPPKKGTRVTVRAQNFDTEQAQTLLTKHLQKKRGAEVWIGDILLNDTHSDTIIESGINDSALVCSFSEKPQKEESTCTTQIMINGVMVEEMNLSGLGLPKYFAIDLPYDASLPESRNLVDYDDVAYQSVKSLVDKVITKDMPPEQKVQLVNALAPIIDMLQHRIPTLGDKTNLLIKLTEGVVEPFRTQGLNPIPNTSEYAPLHIENALYLSPLLPSVDVPHIPGIKRCHDFVSRHYKAYLIDFTDDATTPIVLDEKQKYLVIDKKIYQKQEDIPVLLDLYINLDKKPPIGTFEQTKRNEEPHKKFPSHFASLEERMKQYRLPDSGSIINYLVNYSFSGQSHDFMDAMGQYIIGDTDVSPVDIRERFGQDKMTALFLNRLATDSAIQEQFVKLRSFLSIFSSESTHHLVSLSPEEVNSLIVTHLKTHIQQNSDTKLFSKAQIRLLRKDIDDQEFIDQFIQSSEEYELPKYISTSIKYISALVELKQLERDEPATAEIVNKYLLINFSHYLDFFPEEITAFIKLTKDDPVLMSSYYENVVVPFIDNPIIARTNILNLVLALHNPQKAFLFMTTFRDYWGKRFSKDIPNNELLEQFRPGEPFDRYKREPSARTLLQRRDLQSLKDMTEAEFFSYMHTIKDELHTGLPIIIENAQKLLNLTVVKNILETNNESFMKLSKREYPTPLSILDPLDMLRDIGTLSHTLSTKQLEIVSTTIAKHFNSNNMATDDCERFITYLKRVMESGGVADDDFHFAQKLYLIYENDPNESKNVSPRHIFDPAILTQIREGFIGLNEETLPDFLHFWGTIADTKIKSLRGSSIDEKLARALTIWREISNQPMTEYYLLLKHFKTQGEKGAIYEYFRENYPDHKIRPEEILPYVLYYREGDRNLSSRESIEPSMYSYDVRLTSLVLARKLRATTFHEATKNADDFQEWLGLHAKIADKDEFVAQRELLHAILHQSMADPYLFIRELIQNSNDVTAKQETTTTQGSMEIEEFTQGDDYVLQVTDHVGMDFDTVMGYLFVPEASSKKGSGDLGKFGIGFLSIFRDAEKVVIKTRKEGKIINVLATPARNEQGIITDINISYTLDDADSDFQGTIIQKHMKRENRPLQSVYVQSSIIKYGAHVDAETIQITFNGTDINYPVKTLASHENFRSLTGAALHVTQGGIYVMDLPEEWLEKVPETIRKELEKTGFVIDLPKDIPLTRSRNDIAGKQKHESLILQIIPSLALQSFLTRFAEDGISYDFIPYDYFFSSYQSTATRPISDDVLHDADIINRGGTLSSYDAYQQQWTRLMELLLVIKIIDYQEEKLSLRDIAERFEQGEEFIISQLPYKLAQYLEKAKDERQRVEAQKKEFEQNGQSIVRDFALTEQDEELLRRNDADILIGFLQLVQQISYHTDGSVQHTYYYSPNGSVAHALGMFRQKGWNLLTLTPLLSKLRAISIQGQINPYYFWKELFDISSHEDAHIEEGTEHWGTHHQPFYDQQKKVLFYLMQNLDISALQQEISQANYPPVPANMGRLLTALGRMSPK